MSVDYLLHESSMGYAIFKVRIQPDAVGNGLAEVQHQMQNLAHFGKMVQLVNFTPFQTAAQALENANKIADGEVSDYLRTVLETNLPKPSSTQTVTLGVSDSTLATSIKTEFPAIKCETSNSSPAVGDLLRGIRQHSEKLLAQLQEGDVERAQLGLGHSYSRDKVKFNVKRNDNHIIQAIATLDNLDKTVNAFSMRIREWYGWHFPELEKIASENFQYAKLVLFIQDRSNLTDDRLYDLAAAVEDDESIAQSIIDAAKISMGRDITEVDMERITTFAKRVVELTKYRKSLAAYLIAKMELVAPNLAALIGETVGARLISQAGSLVNLAKCPASTVQILGAEKALFRALKTKGATPKYGLIYHSSFIGRAGMKNKGRISRFLANKAAIAARTDQFSETPNSRIGQALKNQVEERLAFYATGAPPTKNQDALARAMDDTLASINIGGKHAVAPPVDVDMEDVIPTSVVNTADDDDRAARKAAKKEKKLMKEAKRKAKEAEITNADAEADTRMIAETKDKKEKKKDKKEKREKHKHGKH